MSLCLPFACEGNVTQARGTGQLLQSQPQSESLTDVMEVDKTRERKRPKLSRRSKCSKKRV